MPTNHPPEPSHSRAGGPVPREVKLALIAVVIARTALNGGLRVVLPFLPAIARGLGTTLATMGVLVGLRSLVGVTAPGAAALAERVGRRSVMLGGLAATGIGSAMIGLAPGVWVAAAGFVVVGLGKPMFDVPMQGWFGSRVAYANRGRVLGITELSWAGGLLATVPLSGFLIARTSWRIQFLVVVVLIVAGIVAVAKLMADDRPTHREPTTLVMNRPRFAVLAVVALFTFAAESLFVVYGAWLEADLGFNVAAIGVFSLLVVASELAGEGGVAAIGDRVGLRRAVIGGLLVSSVAYASLPLVGGSVGIAIAVVIGWFIAFEVTIVASVPLVTEIGGQSRDRLLGVMVATIAISRAAGAIVAPQVFERGGIGAMGLLAAAAALAASVVMWRVVPDPAST